MAKKAQGKLNFFDLFADGVKIQIMCQPDCYKGQGNSDKVMLQLEDKDKLLELFVTIKQRMYTSQESM